MTFTSKLKGLVAAATIAVFGAGGANAAVIDLGFSLDESGSVGGANFNLTRDALANALALIPTSGPNQYRVAVTTFASNQTVVVNPTIVTAASIGGIQSAVRATTFSSGGTDTAGAIGLLTSLFTNAGLGDTTLFNVTTDGAPNNQSATISAAQAAAAAGVDGLSFEAIGTNPTLINQMLQIAFPTTPVHVTNINNIPDPTTTGFVVEVSNFADYEAAIRAKVQQVVIDTGGGPSPVPLPASLPLLLAGLAGVAALRRRAA